MALTGHLSDLSLSELIEFFCNQRKTGQLKVLYPDGYGYFYLQAGSVIDARIGVLRGIDAVYYALTLPNAKFEFGPAAAGLERTINQPWTQVVLEGLRRLDEGVIPAPAFPPDYKEAESQPPRESASSDTSDLEELRVPGFLSFIGKESMSRRKYIAGAVAVVVVMVVAAIGVPAGWYGSRVTPVVSQPSTTEAPVAPATVPQTPAVAQIDQPTTGNLDDSDAAKRQRERDRIKVREEREGKAALATSPVATTPADSALRVLESPKAGAAKRVTVTVTYDESGRVTQASGGDATAVRIARQKRFPVGKAGSATVTIPIN
jgi:Domain of unknown function (DUF4388)